MLKFTDRMTWKPKDPCVFWVIGWSLHLPCFLSQKSHQHAAHDSHKYNTSQVHSQCRRYIHTYLLMWCIPLVQAAAQLGPIDQVSLFVEEAGGVLWWKYVHTYVRMICFTVCCMEGVPYSVRMLYCVLYGGCTVQCTYVILYIKVLVSLWDLPVPCMVGWVSTCSVLVSLWGTVLPYCKAHMYIPTITLCEHTYVRMSVFLSSFTSRFG